jgi:hypothetical protein
MTKKPSTLKIDGDKTAKRNRGIPSNFEARKADYIELKKLRKVLKDKKDEKIEQVINYFLYSKIIR